MFYPDECGPIGLLTVDHPIRGHVTALVPGDHLRTVLNGDFLIEGLVIGEDGREPMWIDGYPWNWGPNRRAFLDMLVFDNIE